MWRRGREKTLAWRPFYQPFTSIILRQCWRSSKPVKRLRVGFSKLSVCTGLMYRASKCCKTVVRVQVFSQAVSLSAVKPMRALWELCESIWESIVRAGESMFCCRWYHWSAVSTQLFGNCFWRILYMYLVIACLWRILYMYIYMYPANCYIPSKAV